MEHNVEHYVQTGTPLVIREFKRSWMFGIISVHYYVEDRRPDMEVGYYEGKYKHYLNLNVFGTKLNWTFRTTYPYEDLPYDEDQQKRKLRNMMERKRKQETV